MDSQFRLGLDESRAENGVTALVQYLPIAHHVAAIVRFISYRSPTFRFNQDIGGCCRAGAWGQAWDRFTEPCLWRSHGWASKKAGPEGSILHRS
jgi:hypothetical protein